MPATARMTARLAKVFAEDALGAVAIGWFDVVIVWVLVVDEEFGFWI